MVLDPANGVAKRRTQNAFSCCDAILETGPAAPQ
jgi:hypothetical protein